MSEYSINVSNISAIIDEDFVFSYNYEIAKYVRFYTMVVRTRIVGSKLIIDSIVFDRSINVSTLYYNNRRVQKFLNN